MLPSVASCVLITASWAVASTSTTSVAVPTVELDVALRLFANQRFDAAKDLLLKSLGLNFHAIVGWRDQVEHISARVRGLGRPHCIRRYVGEGYRCTGHNPTLLVGYDSSNRGSSGLTPG